MICRVLRGGGYASYPPPNVLMWVRNLLGNHTVDTDLDFSACELGGWFS